ncbi:MAG: hypothetical protein DME48_14250 [Verrucomicrobia bacterium]|nr:MAG: hypothetical protein DME48_14250 [Verrucomicrobiota bacterium]
MKSRNFFAELKRRNVYKVAVAYAVAGWALAQGIAQVFPVFDIPNWAVRLIVLGIVIGFPIALVIAWAFELTPEGIKRTEDVDPFKKAHLDLCRCDWSRVFHRIVFYRTLHGAEHQQWVFQRIAGKIDRSLAAPE